MKACRVAVIGCGVVGAMVAYELSQIKTLDVVLIDKDRPAQGATSAALGVLMGVISHKVKGRNWRLRKASLERYKTLIPELEARLDRPIPFNRQGILSLCFDPERLPRWQSLQNKRHGQGYLLEIWSPEQLVDHCPHINPEQVQAAIYSPQDGQVNPQELTLALVEAAQQQGVQCHWQTDVTALVRDSNGYDNRQATGRCLQVQTTQGSFEVDWVILTAGLGSMPLTEDSLEPVPMIPVLGQAIEIEVPNPLGHDTFQPVINGQDVHLVPLGQQRYWVGATVEFPPESGIQSLDDLQPQDDLLDQVWQTAVGYCPSLALAQRLRSWIGFRPRPQGQSAPVIKPLTGFSNVIVATGHYRNGVLLAPATALAVRENFSVQ